MFFSSTDFHSHPIAYYLKILEQNIKNDPNLINIAYQKSTYFPSDFPHVPNGKVLLLLEKAKSWLNRNYSNLIERERPYILFRIFDFLDIYIKNSGLQGLLFLEDDTVVNLDKYWSQKANISPISSVSNYANSIGVIEINDSEIINLNDLFSMGHNPLRKIDELKIGLFPLSDHFNIIWKYTGILSPQRETYGMVTDKVENKEYYNELDELVEIIVNKSLHIVCLPELIICDNGIEFLQKKLISKNLDFLILVGGSFHRYHPDYPNFQNTMPILLFQNRKMLKYQYSKLEPASVTVSKFAEDETQLRKQLLYFEEVLYAESFNKLKSRSLMEAIVPDSSIIVLYSEEFGKMGFAICKDMLPTSSSIAAKYSKLVDHLFVISQNGSPRADFSQQAIHFANEKKVSTFYVNTKKYDPKRNTPSFYFSPSMRNIREIRSNESYLVSSLKKRIIHSRVSF